jgi:hypothetical protein
MIRKREKRGFWSSDREESPKRMNSESLDRLDILQAYILIINTYKLKTLSINDSYVIYNMHFPPCSHTEQLLMEYLLECLFFFLNVEKIRADSLLY